MKTNHWQTTLTGPFGEVVVDVERPCVRSLKLRQGDGTLGVKSLLSAWPSETLPYTTGAYSYIQDMAGVRYESLSSRQHTVAKVAPDEIVIRGIALLPDNLRLEAPVIEDWRFALEPNGDLRWEITQHWQRDCEVWMSATPGLFFNLRANAAPTGSGQQRLNPEQNGVATLLWIRPEMIETQRWHSELRPGLPSYQDSFLHENCVVYSRRDAWAAAKLYTSFPNDRDLFLKVAGGYLFRRGKYNSHNELGLLIDPRNERYDMRCLQPRRRIRFARGERVSVALALGSRAATQTGHQLAVAIPDAAMQQSLTLFHNGLANAGMWTSQSEYGTGNQVEGWNIGTFWMPAVALAVGVAAPNPLSADPYTPWQAWRAEMERLLNLVSPQGQIKYGFCAQRNREGYLTPENELGFVERLELYYVATGDTELIAKHFDKLTLLMESFEPYRQNDLLVFDRRQQKLLIYFDAWQPDGTITYLNNRYVRAQEAYATLLTVTGRPADADRVLARREATIRAMNRTLWDDHAYGAGRGGYVDFLDPAGQKHCFFCSGTEYPAIVFGIADAARSAAILQTADERLAELTKQYGCKGDATLDTLWPTEKDMIGAHATDYPFGTYQNGSVLNCWTYFEVLARCRCGDVERAYELLRRFAEHAGRTNWFEGDSAFNIRSEPHGWGQEPYLSDQVTVAAALVHGLLGIRQTPQGVQVSGRLPAAWDKATAIVPCLGKHYKVKRTRENTAICECPWP